MSRPGLRLVGWVGVSDRGDEDVDAEDEDPGWEHELDPRAEGLWGNVLVTGVSGGESACTPDFVSGPCDPVMAIPLG